ncbi:MAG: carboxypeptidase-like regulatory domain-containing protein, partial [Candidatus Xenobia bacterium]
ELFCGIHTTMNAYIVVLQNQFFAMPDAKHNYVIPNVPRGHYVLHAWHPRIDGMATKEIDVPEKGSVKVDFTL